MYKTHSLMYTTSMRANVHTLATHVQ